MIKVVLCMIEVNVNNAIFRDECRNVSASGAACSIYAKQSALVLELYKLSEVSLFREFIQKIIL